MTEVFTMPIAFCSFFSFQQMTCSTREHLQKPCQKYLVFTHVFIFFKLIFRVCHMNPDPTCNSCFAEDGLSDSHSIMTSSVASSFQSIPCSTVSVFATAANTPIQ